MPQFIEKSFFNAMSVRKNLQHLKALEGAPHGTLAFRSYMLKRCIIKPHNKAFGSLKLNILLPPLHELRLIAGILSAVKKG